MTILQPSCALPTRAYNLELLKEDARPGPDSHGWCFGLLPGISPEQWPLDPLTGYPLVHGFTLRLPEDYRCHGPEIVGFSFFAPCSEHSDGGTAPDEAIQATMIGTAAPADPRYLPFWTAVQNSHPRLRRMVDDVFSDNFAAILLTEAELSGALCRPPDMTAARALSRYAAPRWLETGSGRVFFDDQTGLSTSQAHYIYKTLGSEPDARIDWSRALRWSPRANDPNAGKAPQDPFTGDKKGWISAALLLRRRRHHDRDLPRARLDRRPRAEPHRRHHAAGAGNAAVQPILCRV